MSTTEKKRQAALRKRRRDILKLFGVTTKRGVLPLDRHIDHGVLKQMAAYIHRHTGARMFGGLVTDETFADDLMRSAVQGTEQLVDVTRLVHEHYGCDPTVDCVPTHVEELMALARAGQEQEQEQRPVVT